MSLSGTGNMFKGISLTDTAKGGRFYLNDPSSDVAGLSVMAEDGKDFLSVGNREGKSVVLSSDKISFDNAVLFGGKEGPYLNLTDGQGFQAQLGVSGTVSTVTGHQQTTSAASLVMFGKDGKVIWSAPH